MKLDDLLEMLESDTTDDRKARRKAAYFDSLITDEKLYRLNRKNKHDYDDVITHEGKDRKQRFAKFDRSKRA